MKRKELSSRNVEKVGSNNESMFTILDLPEELIVLIVSFCQPNDLNRLSHVCRQFSVLIENDMVWRKAFMMRFNTKASLVRRLKSSTWKKEYLARMALYREWTRNKGQQMQLDLGIGPVDQIYSEEGKEIILASRDT
eukprot:Ihof_evm5s632 gene=Ihof_evmTU5s632